MKKPLSNASAKKKPNVSLLPRKLALVHPELQTAQPQFAPTNLSVRNPQRDPLHLVLLASLLQGTNQHGVNAKQPKKQNPLLAAHHLPLLQPILPQRRSSCPRKQAGTSRQPDEQVMQLQLPVAAQMLDHLLRLVMQVLAQSQPQNGVLVLLAMVLSVTALPLIDRRRGFWTAYERPRAVGNRALLMERGPYRLPGLHEQRAQRMRSLLLESSKHLLHLSPS